MPALLQIDNASLSVGPTQLLEGANALVVEGQRVALVGLNGNGKSTLLRALADIDEQGYWVVGAGAISRRDGSNIFLVDQEMKRWSCLLGGDDESLLLDLPIAEALDVAVAEAFHEDAFENSEMWRKLCVAANEAGLAWDTAEYDTCPLKHLSPGAASRAYLALVLHSRSIDVVLLDEPTNHLDLPSIVWLQETLLASGKAAVIVSHDQSFLDAVCDHVWEIDSITHSLTVSGASYSAYRHAKEVAREQQRAAFDAQQRRDAKLIDVANRLRTASTRGSHHIATDNDKLQRDFRRDRAGRSGRKAKAIDKRREAAPRVERLVERAHLRIMIDPVLPSSSNSGIQVSSVKLGYSSTEPLPLPAISLRVDFGEHVALVGFNGCGKSTLLRTITGTLKPLTGTVSIGGQLRIGSLTQEHEDMPLDKTPREYVGSIGDAHLFEVGQYLIRYGLSLQQVDRPIGHLNPGARVRTLIAGFSMRRVNVLVLDEPTNHLDEEAIEEVISTLNNFAGTVIVVSHNRAFLESLQRTHLIQLSADGLRIIELLDEFVGEIENAVSRVIQAVAP